MFSVPILRSGKTLCFLPTDGLRVYVLFKARLLLLCSSAYLSNNCTFKRTAVLQSTMHAHRAQKCGKIMKDQNVRALHDYDVTEKNWYMVL